MASVKAAVSSGFKLCEPLICVGLKAVLRIPDGVVEAGVKWVKERFTDHSVVITKAIATANDRAWQAVALALATDNLFSHVANLFRDGDLKAVQKQIREFVATSDSGIDVAAAGLRTKACDELLTHKKAVRFAFDEAELTSLDLTRFASAAKVADDAHRAVTFIAADLKDTAPHLAQVLALTPPGGGTPLLAAAFAYFLRREIATKPELARELLYDGVRLLTLKQQAGFSNLEQVIETKSDEVLETIGGWFVTADADLADIKTKLEQLLEQHQVSKKPESPLRVSVTSDIELQRLKRLRDRLREQPVELVDAELQSLLGDGLAAAGQYADAANSHAAAADSAKEDANRTVEADAAYKQFKDACELKQWDTALAALNRAVALDSNRFRPVPKHYVIEAILGVGSFGVVLKCRNTISFDEDGNELVLAVKSFREADLERPLKDVLGEAHTLKTLTHENVIRIHDHGFADADGQQRPFLAMEFVAGATLEDHLSQHGKLTVADFTAIFLQIAAALHAAHTGRRQIIHRDLKPANVMVWKDGDVWRVKVIDFGLAVRGAIRTASLSVPHSLRATRDKSVTGTMKYAAPEQLGEKPYPIGPWSDVFAFGKTALEAVLGTVQPSLEDWDDLPKELATLLNRCVSETYLADDPSKRRFHGFGPVLPVLCGEKQDAPATAIQAEADRRRAEEKAHEKEQQRQVEVETRRKEVQEREDLVVKLAEETARRQQAEKEAGDKHSRLCASNLERWKLSGEPEQWAAARPGGWDHATWLGLLADLERAGVYWPMAAGAVGEHLEVVRERVRLERAREDERTHAQLLPTTPIVPLVAVPSPPVVPAAKPVRKAGDKFALGLPGGAKMAFAWCPPGTFLMGSPASEKGRWDQEQQHEVRLTKGFYAGVHPVTQAEWAAVMRTEPSGFKGADLPVENVIWDDALGFCGKLRELTDKQVRLPTEAEWEYACRGGTTTPFYWGSELNGTQANIDGNHPYGTSTKGPYLQMTTPVGSYTDKASKKHPWGLADVHGNVWEWCADWYDEGYYARSPKDDPECRDGVQKYRVLRGGSWYCYAGDCCAARRNWYEPARRYSSNYGFRVVFCPD